MPEADLYQLSQRLAEIERRLNSLEQNRSVPQPVYSHPSHPATFFSAPSVTPVSPKIRSTTELEIGQKWLSIAGIILLFLGILFFVSYIFQYISAVEKVGLSYAVALGLGVVAFATHKKYTFFSGIVTAGAWGVAYLTTYAMHFFIATRIVTSPLVEMCLLVAVVLALLIMALWQQSRTLVALGLVLGFVTMIISPLSLFSILGTLFITAVAVALAIALPWGDILLVAAAGSAVSYYMWFSDVVAKLPVQGGGLAEKNTLGLIVLILLWVLISAGLLFRRDKALSLSGHIDVVTLLITSLSTLVFGIATLQPIVPTIERPAIAVFLVLLTGLHVGWSLIAASRNRSDDVNTIAGVASLLLGMASIVYIFPADSSAVSVTWAALGLLIVAAGVVWKKQTFTAWALLPLVGSTIRFIANDLNEAGFIGAAIPADLIVGLLNSLAFVGALALLRSVPELRKSQTNIRHIPSVVLITLLLLLYTLTNKEFGGAFPSVLWGLMGLAVVAVGFFARWKDARIVGLCALAATILRVFIHDLSGLSVLPRVVSFMALGGMLLLLGYGYNHYKDHLQKYLEEEE